MTEDNKMKDLLEPYQIALRLEEEGKKFFLEAAANTESTLARQTFEFLAAEEDKHIEVIQRFYQSLVDSDGKEPMRVDDSDADARFELFQTKLESMKTDFDGAGSDSEAYRYALEFENGAEEFYERMLNEADDPRVKKFYAWLITEESMHSRLINSCLKFVEDPVAWFRKRKK
ncbi:MAG: ferritin family protein [bacterium]|nr:ferritin family protein [bacterium]